MPDDTPHPRSSRPHHPLGASGDAPAAGPPSSTVATVAEVAAVLETVPHRLGYEPLPESLVVLFRHDGHIDEALRLDLARWEDLLDRPPAPRTRCYLIGYGHVAQVAPVLGTLGFALALLGTPAQAAVRIDDGHWYGPPTWDGSGHPYHPGTDPAAGTAGPVVFPDPAAVLALVHPPAGPDTVQAAHEALRRTADHNARNRDRQRGVDPVAEGFGALTDATVRHRSGGILDDDQIARLTLALRHPAVVEHALGGILHGHTDPGLWRDVTVRAAPETAAPPATLFGYAAWAHHNLPVAAAALTRALDTDPDYLHAHRLARLLSTGIQASTLDTPAATGQRPPAGPTVQTPDAGCGR